MAINAKKKGGRGEKLACELLKEWTGKKFARVPQSGGLHWKMPQTCGDVVCLAEKHNFPFSVEVKNHKDLNFSHLLVKRVTGRKANNTPSDIILFWEQCVRDAKEAKKTPLLLMRYDNLPKDFFFVVLDFKIWRGVMRTVGDSGWGYEIKEMDILIHKAKSHTHQLIFLRSDEFFKIPYKQFKKSLIAYENSKKH